MASAPPGFRRIDAELPLDRTTHERVVRAVLAWSDPGALRPDDIEQVGLLLAGAAHAVADDIRALAAARTPARARPRPLTTIAEFL
ncbi:hypothetical protein OIE50_01400 [Streptomyces canus]|uniref:hypothetical protein n=1 Tax=Streptomyces canus TaxID=58343 RepID=UPI00324364D9